MRQKTILAASLVLAMMGGTEAAAQDEDRYIIKFKDGAAERGKSAARQAGAEILLELKPQGAAAARIPAQALEGLRKNPNVEYIEQDAPRYPLAQTVPYGIPMVQADQVGQGSLGNRKVCIIDSGYYVGHEDLQAGNVTGKFNSGTGNWYEDSCGHGTHVAGTVAALHNNTGVVGVASTGALKMHIVKVFNGTSCGWAYSSGLVAALNECTAEGSNVVSMSLGGGVSSTTENTAFQNAYNAGVLSIAAAGNGGNNRHSYPASYSSVISVAAVDSNKVRASFSQYTNQVEVSAPGVSVLSTVPWSGASTVVDGTAYLVSAMDGSVQQSKSGGLVDGGRCLSTVAGASGKVVLCERGDISFNDKAKNAAAGGGVAAIIYNNEPGSFAGTLGTSGVATIPVVSMSREDGLYIFANKLGTSATVNTISTVPGSGYEAWDGTSMATPHVSGVAALVWSHNPAWTNVQIREALQATAEDLGGGGRDNYYGYGLVRACEALKYLGGSCGGSTAPTPTPVPSEPTPTPVPSEPTPTPVPSEPTPTPVPSEGPVISNVKSVKDKGNRFTVSWTTNEPATSTVTFTGGASGTFTNSTLKTSHSMSFNGSKGVLYTYEVSSTNAAGGTSTSGGHTHQN
jgi:serine protease